MALTLFFALFSGLVNAQTRISGKITDSVTSTPLADASVYIVNSTIGTKTDKNGEYSFAKLSPGSYQLIASCLGYQTRQVALTAKPGDNVVNMMLNTRSIELKEVTISARDDWKHNLTLFKKEFIGTTLSQECSILNPEILNLDFDYKSNRLTASTDDFLEIENSSLGYKLRFLVKDFWADYNTRKCHYSGSVIFEEMAGKKGDEKKWAKNRLNTYNGSFRHFLTALYHGRLDEEKFLVIPLFREPNTNRPPDSLVKEKNKFYVAKMRSGQRTQAVIDSAIKWSKLAKMPKVNEKLGDKRLRETDLVKDISVPESYPLQFPGYIYVIYKNKHIDMDFEDLIRFKDAAWDYQIAALSLKDPSKPTLFNGNGLLLTNESLYYEGAWTSRIVSLLPSDYMPNGK
jgi:hypothetical protein